MSEQHNADNLDSILRHLYRLEALVESAGLNAYVLEDIGSFIKEHDDWKNKQTTPDAAYQRPLVGCYSDWVIEVRRAKQVTMAFTSAGAVLVEETNKP
jgi:hypothetical protein